MMMVIMTNMIICMMITSLLVPACPARLAMLTTCPALLAIMSGRNACEDSHDDCHDDGCHDDCHSDCHGDQDHNDNDNDKIVDKVSGFSCNHVGKECLC